jgi:hypothetical protein
MAYIFLLYVPEIFEIFLETASEKTFSNLLIMFFY